MFLDGFVQKLSKENLGGGTDQPALVKEGLTSVLSTDSFLAIWQSQYKFLANEFLIRKVCRGQ